MTVCRLKQSDAKTRIHTKEFARAAASATNRRGRRRCAVHSKNAAAAVETSLCARIVGDCGRFWGGERPTRARARAQTLEGLRRRVKRRDRRRARCEEATQRVVPDLAYKSGSSQVVPTIGNGLKQQQQKIRPHNTRSQSIIAAASGVQQQSAILRRSHSFFEHANMMKSANVATATPPAMAACTARRRRRRRASCAQTTRICDESCARALTHNILLAAHRRSTKSFPYFLQVNDKKRRQLFRQTSRRNSSR